MAKGKAVTRRKIPMILEDTENGLNARFRELIARQYQRFLDLDEELAWYKQRLIHQAETDETCQRLVELPAFGPVVSSAFKSWMGDGKQFKRGRDASAALGVMPRQHSTGGKEVLLGISKRGDSYVRSLLIHGARSVVARAKKKTDSLSCWINKLVVTRGFNKAAVALANKVIRIAWAIVRHNERYKPQIA